ncbi:MAG: gamma-glutamyl-gamma-aminobutyrate hydrolase family protein [Firmicutes bacterium]|nr:gamma-glutamyl-gamma-aminobutyrate hydrolase family protein [Bacillota bacterium]
MKPLIGITTYFISNSEMYKSKIRGLSDQDILMSSMDYYNSVENSGGIPIAIPIITKENIKELVNKLDGIIFSGGVDINPLKYDNNINNGIGKIIPKRDDFEFLLLKEMFKSKKPILGICRGLQLINVFFKGTLHQDISLKTNIKHSYLKAPKYLPCHRVCIDVNTKLYDIFKSKKIYVNSFHHQTVKDLGENLLKTAWSDDGFIEAIEHKNYPFLLAVQWHPEMMAIKDSKQLNIFKVFINAIKKGY